MNQLGAETSPYLLQHKDNPVEWRVWGEAALAEARAADKPILLSVGYAACHWCHVMAHESFENPGIAALMNAYFVPIKVDREERPDIDAIYQHALALTGQQGGWPLTMFLTPAGEPFWGGTYFPPENRWGRTGFADVLRGVSATYREEREKVTGNVKLLTEGLQRFSAAVGSAPVEPEFIDRLATRLAGGIDKHHGGLGGAPKFPNCPILGLLWRAAHRRDEAAWRDPVLLTLDRMSAGGIYDHLGGGYARYSTDERWLAPHFEKMLYDNAQILELLVWAWQATGRELFATRIADTIGWLLREMRMAGGAFAATIDADSEHVEGKFYVWSEAEIDALLGDAAALFKRHYDVSAHGNWEETNILNRLRDPKWDDAGIDAALAPSREILFRARELRIRPGLDDKILADWNGLAISALVQAALAFDRPDWLAAAIAAWDFIVATLRRDDGRLLHSWCRGRTHPGTLDDHAFMSRAGLALYQATGDAAYLTQTVAWVEDLEAHFRDREHGGYFFAADDTENLIARIRQATDAAIPSGNGVMVEVLTSLWHLTGEARWRDLTDSQIAAFSGNLAQQGASLATWLGGVELLRGAVEITLAGPPGRADTEALRRVVLGAHLPNRVLVPWVEGAQLPTTHPAFGKTMAGDKAAAYVCRNEVCSAPITDPAELAKLLAE